MLSTRWHKVLVDLWKNRVRTLVVAVAIGVGVYAIGVVLNIGELVVREYRADQDGALLASAIVRTMPFDDDLAERVAEIPGVAAAEGRQVARTKFYGSAGTPKELKLVAVPDFAKIEVDAITPLEGKWPPGKRMWTTADPPNAGGEFPARTSWIPANWPLCASFGGGEKMKPCAATVRCGMWCATT